MCTGSRITNDDGTCASTGGFTTDIRGVAEGMEKETNVTNSLKQSLQQAVDSDSCQGRRCPADFAEMSNEDKELAQSILDSKPVLNAMGKAWTNTLETGKEHGFWIYKSLEVGFFAGKMKVGNSTSVQLGNPLNMVYQKRRYGVYGSAQARFHTHPGDYPNAARPSVGDLDRPAYLMFIYTYRGIIKGRHRR